jgi:branched-chain amino acid transport system substrate-binding protein
VRRVIERGPRAVATLVALAVMATTVAACGRGSDDSSGNAGGGSGAKAEVGVTDKAIKLGGIYAFTGPSPSFEASYGAKAYFQMINDQGGVNGRKIDFITRDGQYQPGQTLQAARQLVQQDKVFALFHVLGTPTNAAIFDYVDQVKVPNLLVETGASMFGSDPKAHPMTTTYQPPYPDEAEALGNYVAETKPNGKVGILYQNDSLGQDFVSGFTKGIEGSNVKIIKKQSYEVTDPSVNGQVSNLKASGADVFLNATTPKFAAQAIARVGAIGWKPLQLIPNLDSSPAAVLKPAGLENAKGLVSTAWFKSAGDPSTENDEAVQQFVTMVEKYQPKGDPSSSAVQRGWIAAQMLTDALKKLKNPTRESLLNALRNQDTTLPILLEGIRIQTSPTDGFPVQSVYIEKFDGTSWKVSGDVQSFDTH